MKALLIILLINSTECFADKDDADESKSLSECCKRFVFIQKYQQIIFDTRIWYTVMEKREKEGKNSHCSYKSMLNSKRNVVKMLTFGFRLTWMLILYLLQHMNVWWIVIFCMMIWVFYWVMVKWILDVCITVFLYNWSYIWRQY